MVPVASSQLASLQSEYHALSLQAAYQRIREHDYMSGTELSFVMGNLLAGALTDVRRRTHKITFRKAIRDEFADFEYTLTNRGPAIFPSQLAVDRFPTFHSTYKSISDEKELVKTLRAQGHTHIHLHFPRYGTLVDRLVRRGIRMDMDAVEVLTEFGARTQENLAHVGVHDDPWSQSYREYLAVAAAARGQPYPSR